MFRIANEIIELTKHLKKKLKVRQTTKMPLYVEYKLAGGGKAKIKSETEDTYSIRMIHMGADVTIEEVTNLATTLEGMYDDIMALKR